MNQKTIKQIKDLKIETERGKKLNNLLKEDKKYKKRFLNNSFIQFKSKKNTVALIMLDNKFRIIKWYAPGFIKNFEIEYKMLKNTSKELKIPTIYEKDVENNILIINYIIGKNLNDIINDSNIEFYEKNRIIILTSDWFKKFHNNFNNSDTFLIRGDSVLRNFIYNTSIWGVDFENSRNGKPCEDIASMCCSILSTNPMFTKEKFVLCENLINSYSKSVKWDLDNIGESISYALLEKIQWRPDEELLFRKYSNIIKKRGITIY